MALDFKRMFWKRNAGAWRKVQLGLDGRECRVQLAALRGEDATAKFSVQLTGPDPTMPWFVVAAIEPKHGVPWVKFFRMDARRLETLWELVRQAKTPTDLRAAVETYSALWEL